MPARLHHEDVTAPGATPARWLVLTHGIYGAGTNLRAVARKLVERRPDRGVVLVDLRLHGRSDPGAPPHTVAACAGDLAALVATLRAGASAREVDAIAGHSFGGKVALAARRQVAPRQTWVLDASPSARPGAMTDPHNTVVAVLALMERLPRTWSRRDDFVAAITAAGHPAGLGQWLAMNLIPDGHGALALRLELAAIRALLADYFATDLWPEVVAPAPGALVFVIATRSDAVTAADRARLATTPATVHELDAGHWLHVDAPAAVVELFAMHLP